eukprot:CAMPEP_0170075222 /NCGR_PEP_ID=MMETSP0019_2-20121128/12398_1 /TAXON_ID=98059 /ORGANISM="Dinobryon sp., Strain UTEXLB2267" /LENGTH=445 /DNA_ID=CAMNT_0010286053 /DNA_START=78 /DNA_END=1415 /DNA_ORIENTATION=+
MSVEKGKFHLTATTSVEDLADVGQYTCIIIIKADSKTLTLSAGNADLKESWTQAILLEVKRLREKKCHEEALLSKEKDYVKSLTDHSSAPVPRSNSKQTSQKLTTSQSNLVHEISGKVQSIRINNPNPEELEKEKEKEEREADTINRTKSNKRLSQNVTGLQFNSKGNSDINNQTKVGLNTPTVTVSKKTISSSSSPVTPANSHPANKNSSSSSHVQVSISSSERTTVFSFPPSESSGGVDDASKAAVTEVDDICDGWIEARTEEGAVYYYHKETRLTRWDKPEKHIMAALESRLKESKESSDRAIRDRKLANQREKDLLLERERVIDENKSVIADLLRQWQESPRGDVLSFVALLRTLPVVLPADMLEISYQHAASKGLFDSLLQLSSDVAPTEIKKAYLKVIRLIHPDKVPPDLAIESKALLEGVFIVLQEKYDLYRKANDIG